MKTNQQTKKLGEVCDIQTGKWDANHAVKDGKYRFYTCAYKYGFCNTKRFSGECLVLPGNGVNVGEVFYYQGNFDAYQRTYVINNIKIFPKFLYYHLFCFWKERNLNKQFGSATNFLKIGNFLNYEISYPESFPIQIRIVKILDKAFAEIETAKKNAERNLQNAKELFESYLQEVFANGGDDWEKKKLIDIFQIKPPKKEAKEKLKDNDSVSFVPMKDLQVMSKELVCSEERKLKEVSGSYTYFANEDVLLAKITPCFENGKLGIARNLKNGIGFGSSEYIVFRSKGEVVPDYLYYFLARSQFRKEGAKRMSGAVGHKRVSKEFIEDSILLFPKSIKIQKQIVAKLDALSASTKKLEKNYQREIDDLEELKKAVLKRAFAGEL